MYFIITIYFSLFPKDLCHELCILRTQSTISKQFFHTFPGSRAIPSSAVAIHSPIPLKDHVSPLPPPYYSGTWKNYINSFL